MRRQTAASPQAGSAPPSGPAMENPFESANPFRGASERDIPNQLLVTGYYERFFRERRQLGSGSFGQVYLCEHFLDDLSLGEYAVKKIPVGNDRDHLKKVVQEVKLREKIRHPNIVDYKHAWLEVHRMNNLCPFVPWLFVLMQFCNGGSLEDVCRQQPITDAAIWVVLRDVLLGLQNLHHFGILHRDLKPSNILVDLVEEKGCQRLVPHFLLADFGTSQLFTDPRGHQASGYTGTMEYTAPELLKHSPPGEDALAPSTPVSPPVLGASVKSDMWSLGIILYELLFGRLPFVFENDEESLRIAVLAAAPNLAKFPPALRQWSRRTPDLLSIAQALLSPHPGDRPDTDELLHHNILQERFMDEELLRQGEADLLRALAPPTPQEEEAGLARRSSSLSRASLALRPIGGRSTRTLSWCGPPES